MVAFGIFPVFIASMLLQRPTSPSKRIKIPYDGKGKFNKSVYLEDEFIREV
jgi:hypothetical protein